MPVHLSQSGPTWSPSIMSPSRPASAASRSPSSCGLPTEIVSALECASNTEELGDDAELTAELVMVNALITQLQVRQRRVQAHLEVRRSPSKSNSAGTDVEISQKCYSEGVAHCRHEPTLVTELSEQPTPRPWWGPQHGLGIPTSGLGNAVSYRLSRRHSSNEVPSSATLKVSTPERERTQADGTGTQSHPMDESRCAFPVEFWHKPTSTHKLTERPISPKSTTVAESAACQASSMDANAEDDANADDVATRLNIELPPAAVEVEAAAVNDDNDIKAESEATRPTRLSRRMSELGHGVIFEGGVCCICEKDYRGRGRDARCVGFHGRCCYECHKTIVTPNKNEKPHRCSQQ